jgi:gamma-glutamylcyclotransferase (GGCT)/AIG2-like uncharacterized protein YtfP
MAENEQNLAPKHKPPSSKDLPHVVAVFGNQRRDCDNNSYLRDAEHIGLGRVHGFHLYIDGGQPVIREAKSHEPYVIVDLFRVSNETLRRLDIYEGHNANSPDDSMQIRKGCKARLADGSAVFAYIWVYNTQIFAHAYRVPDGDYVAYLAKQIER